MKAGLNKLIKTRNPKKHYEHFTKSYDNDRKSFVIIRFEGAFDVLLYKKDGNDDFKNISSFSIQN